MMSDEALFGDTTSSSESEGTKYMKELQKKMRIGTDHNHKKQYSKEEDVTEDWQAKILSKTKQSMKQNRKAADFTPFTDAKIKLKLRDSTSVLNHSGLQRYASLKEARDAWKKEHWHREASSVVM